VSRGLSLFKGLAVEVAVDLIEGEEVEVEVGVEVVAPDLRLASRSSCLWRYAASASSRVEDTAADFFSS